MSSVSFRSSRNFSSESNFSPEGEKEKITALKNQVNQRLEQTCWVLIEEASKTSTYVKGQFLKIGQSCFKLAQYYFSKNTPEKAAYYGGKAFNYLNQCCAYPTYPSLDSRNWFLISNLYAFQAKLNPINQASLDQKLSLIQQELSAIHAALREVYHPQAMLRKWELLQILEAKGLPTAESSLACLRSYLDHHPDPMSDDYLEKTSFYFAKRALKEKRTEAALLEWKKPSKEPFFLSSEIDNLIRDCESGSLKDQEIRATADLLILNCLHTKDLFLARKGLCSLLKLPIAQIQKDVIDCLKALFRLSYLADDVKKGFESIIFSEEAIRSCIQSFDLSISSEQFLAFLDLYTDIVERLWLLPYLTSEKSNAIKHHSPQLFKRAQLWILSLSKDHRADEKAAPVLATLQLIFQTISFCPPSIERKIKELKSQLHSSILPILIGNIYQDMGGNYRTIKYCLYNLNSFVFRETEDLKNEVAILGCFGIGYQSLGEYRKAIEYQEKRLKISRDLGDRAIEGNAYENLGSAYGSLGEYRKAIEYHEKSLEIALELGNRASKGNAYGKLGSAYGSLGEYRKAIEYHKQILKMALELGDRTTEGKAYGNLGQAYHSLGDAYKAIEYQKKSLEIVLELGDRAAEGKIYIDFGNLYYSLGKYRKAIDYFQKCLQLSHRDIEGGAHGGLGNVYHSLGEHQRAIKCFEESLQIFNRLKDRKRQGTSYGNLGNVYNFLGKHEQALENYKEQLKISLEIDDQIGKMIAYQNLGNHHYSLKKYRKAISYHERALQIALSHGQRESEKAIYGNLANIFDSLGEYTKGTEYLKKCLKLAREIYDRVGEGMAEVNLGIDYGRLEDFPRSEKHFRRAIHQFSILQQELENNYQSKITIFERQSSAYLGLECALVNQKKIREALEATDTRRYRTLTTILSKKLPSLSHHPLALNPLNIQEMKTLAQRLKTTFVVYSVISHTGKGPIFIWIISSQNINYRSISIDALPEELKSASQVLKKFPFISGRPTRPTRRGLFDLDPVQELPILPFLEEMQELYRGGGGGESEEKFKERLSQWYTVFIAPIQDYLPQDPTQTVTIVPDGFLSQLPFAAFQDQERKYLIEKHPLCVAPSLKVLQLLDQLPKEFPSDSLAIGNPTTGNSKDRLALAEKEVKEKVAPILNISPDRVWMQQAPTVGNVLTEMPKARFIHLACHGLSGDRPEEKLDPHSVFEGVLKLAPDKKHKNGYLYAEEIAALSLQADLVFMSACFSGRGKLQREGTIGHNWSFLAAGARSTISTYWRLPEDNLTLEMVETFYRHLLGKETKKLSKAQALQQAVLMAIEKERNNPHKWGAFFLSGLDDTCDPTLTSQLTTEKTNLNEGVSFPNTDHSIESSSITAFSSGSSFLNPPTEIHSFKQSLSHPQTNPTFNHLWGGAPKNTDEISIREMNSNPWKVRGFIKMVQETWLEKQLKDLCAEKVDWAGSITDANCDLLDLSSLLNEAKKNVPTCLLINSHLHYSLIIYDPGQQTIYRFNSLSVQENELEKKVIEKIQELLQVKQVVLNKRASQNGIEDGWSCAFHGLHFLEHFLQGDSMDMIDRQPLTEAALASKLTHYYRFLSQELTKIPETHLAFFEVSLAEKTISELATILKAICIQGLQAQKDDKPVLDSWHQIECILVKLWLLQQKDPSTFRQFVEEMTRFEESQREFLKETLDRIHYQREPIVDLFFEAYKSQYQRAL